MKRRTAKYVAALKHAKRHRITRATTHEHLYAALREAGWFWDPSMGPDGGWYAASEVFTTRPAPRRPPAKPHTRGWTHFMDATEGDDVPPRVASYRGPFEGMPQAAAAAQDARLVAIEQRLEGLKQQLDVIQRALHLLSDTRAVREGLSTIFGIDLAESGVSP